MHKFLILWNYAFSSTVTYQISNDSLSFTDEGQWLICFLLYFKTHHHTKGIQQSIVWDLSFLTSSHSPRLLYSIHSQFQNHALDLAISSDTQTHAMLQTSQPFSSVSFTPITLLHVYIGIPSPSTHYLVTLHQHFSYLHSSSFQFVSDGLQFQAISGQYPKFPLPHCPSVLCHAKMTTLDELS